MSGFKRLWGQQQVRIVILSGLVLASLALLVVILVYDTPIDIVQVCRSDFKQYWCAARALPEKANPYDSRTCAACDLIGVWQDWGPVTTWNPPYTFIVVLPLAALPFDLAAMAWLATNALLVTTCGAVLWHLLAPSGDRRYWLGMLAAVAYMPTIRTILLGQISLWLLAGITGFLLTVRAKRDYLAGAALTLLAIKPHISLIFLVGAAWWVLRERRWKIPLGGLATLAAASAVVTMISPQVFVQYMNTITEPPLYWHTTTLGNWLRVVFGFELSWLLFLPTVIGLILFVTWAMRRKGGWDWQQLAPGLLLASIISAAYGWPHDQVTLLPVVVVLLARLRFLSRGQRALLMSLYVLTQLGMLLLNQYGIDSPYYYWYPLVLAGLYAWQQLMIRLFPHQGANEAPERG